jgi:NADH-quinone oxidoreductase subunit C
MTWREELIAARADGFDVLDWLSAADDPVTVTACLIRSDDPAMSVLITAAAPVASVTDLFASAAWHERETTEMFGVTFAGGDSRPLLTQGGEPPLRKATPLPARTHQPWPGAVDPAKPRRVQQPPGTPWT